MNAKMFLQVKKVSSYDHKTSSIFLYETEIGTVVFEIQGHILSMANHSFISFASTHQGQKYQQICLRCIRLATETCLLLKHSDLCKNIYGSLVRHETAIARTKNATSNR